jgi:hypothetical protein
MRFLILPLLIVGAVVAYRRIMRGQDPDAPPIGPQGRWWWVKLLIAMGVAVAVLALAIWGYLTFLQD